MKNLKDSLFYIITVATFSGMMYWILSAGRSLEGATVKPITSDKSQWTEFLLSLQHNLEHPLALLLAQIVTILFVARFFGWICVKLKQPAVIGEMIAGIVLGPSLIGLYFPEFSAMLFPKESLGNLQFLSQIGLILFMYIVGMELDLKVLKNKAHAAVVISHASIIVPFALGMGLAYYIYMDYAPEGVAFSSFGLFAGISMSVTAFPVLARIVQERGIQKTKLGTIVITCAAADDITAWCILAAVIAIVKAGTFVSALYTIALALGYVFLMLKIVRPFLKRIGDLYSSRESLSKPIVAIFFLTLIISAYATEVIGIHALFGAFMAGAIMPENVKFRNLFIEKVEDVSLVLLLPLFFVFTGLRTQIGLLNDGNLWILTALIILVAITGKFLGSAVAARFVGQSWKDSLTIGALMNTRGLMELVVLNIGYDLGVLSPEIFAMLVIMALVTTFMTGPLLDVINWLFRKSSPEIPMEIRETGNYKILMSFATPGTGKPLFRLASQLTKKRSENATLTAMHVSPLNELHHIDTDADDTEYFRDIIEEASESRQKITTLHKASADRDGEVISVANKGDYDLLLIGLGQSIYEGSLLGRLLGFTTKIINPEKILNTVTGRENLFDSSPFNDSTQQIISRSQVPVGILMDKDFSSADKVVVPMFEPSDAHLIKYAKKLIHNSGSQVVILDPADMVKTDSGIKERIRSIEQTAPNHIALQTRKVIDKDFLKSQDLMIVSLESWKKLLESKSPWLSDIPSVLIIFEKQPQP